MDEELKTMIMGLDKKLDVLQAELKPYREMVEKHERLLYRHNGDPGLADQVEDLLEKEKRLESEKQAEQAEQRKFRYTIIGGIILLVIDLAIRLPWLEIFGVVAK